MTWKWKYQSFKSDFATARSCLQRQHTEKQGWLHSKSRANAYTTSKFFYKMDNIALSFVFDKYCPIMD